MHAVPCSATHAVPCSATHVVPCCAMHAVPCRATHAVPMRYDAVPHSACIAVDYLQFLLCLLYWSEAMSSDTQKGRPPELTSLTVSKIVRNLFCFCDVNTQSVKELPSYVDRNFYFCGTPEASVKNQHEDPGEQAQSEEREYVLKVHNPLLFSCAILGGINTLLDYLQSKGIAECIHPLRSRQGKTVLEITGEDLACYETDTNLKLKTTKDFKEIKYLIVLVTFIPGESLDQIEKSHLTPKLLYDIGNLVGKVDSVLHVSCMHVFTHIVPMILRIALRLTS